MPCVNWALATGGPGIETVRLNKLGGVPLGYREERAQNFVRCVRVLVAWLAGAASQPCRIACAAGCGDPDGEYLKTPRPRGFKKNKKILKELKRSIPGRFTSILSLSLSSIHLDLVAM